MARSDQDLSGPSYFIVIRIEIKSLTFAFGVWIVLFFRMKMKRLGRLQALSLLFLQVAGPEKVLEIGIQNTKLVLSVHLFTILRNEFYSYSIAYMYYRYSAL